MKKSKSVSKNKRKTDKCKAEKHESKALKQSSGQAEKQKSREVEEQRSRKAKAKTEKKTRRKHRQKAEKRKSKSAEARNDSSCAEVRKRRSTKVDETPPPSKKNPQARQQKSHKK